MPSRREFLKTGLTLGAGALAASAGLGCAVEPMVEKAQPAFAALPQRAEAPRVVFEVGGGRTAREVCDAAFAALGGVPWLAPGDSVFLKLACNSGYEHPAVTSPDAVRAVVAYLKEHGAGTVWVGDQAGVEHVRRTPEGRVSSTRQMTADNGLLAAIEESGAEAHFFDDQPWDSFFPAAATFEDHWGGSLPLPGILRDVDHVVYLPRLSAHALTGYTAGIKIAVGWLRDDSRAALHRDGPVFYERVAEINHFQPLADKLRLVLTLGDRALLNVGPDMGGTYEFDGFAALASTGLAEHDAVAAALLPWMDAQTSSFYDMYSPYPEHTNYWNYSFVERIWGEPHAAAYEPLKPSPFVRGMAHDLFLVRDAVLRGARPEKIEVVCAEGGVSAGLATYLRAWDGGRFRLG